MSNLLFISAKFVEFRETPAFHLQGRRQRNPFSHGRKHTSMMYYTDNIDGSKVFLGEFLGL